MSKDLHVNDLTDIQWDSLESKSKEIKKVQNDNEEQ